MEQLRLWLLAVQFFTRIPVAGRLGDWLDFSPQSLTRCTRYFPLVGLVVGAIAAAVYIAASLILTTEVAIVLSVVSTIWITGAFHEDGWADTCDALGTHAGRKRLLEIMTDSRIGAYGAIGLVMMLHLKVSVLFGIDEAWVAAATVCAHSVSRGFAVVIMRTLPYAKPDDESKAKPLAIGLQAKDAWVAWCLAAAAPMALIWYTLEPWPVLWGLGFAAVGTALIRRRLRQRLSGYTGDTLGATQQVSEVLFLMGFLVSLPSL
jgi:adenosylcobinamide-GDP ribazoletransferase